MSEQLTHKNSRFQPIKKPIQLLLDNVTGEANIGSVFRIADAFGIERLIFTGTAPNLKSNRLRRTSRSTENFVEFTYEESALKTIREFKKNGGFVVGLEITETSIPITEIAFNKYRNILIIAGNERTGIDSKLLAVCDEIIHIKMFGENSSMNVAQAVGISLYEITKQLRESRKK